MTCNISGDKKKMGKNPLFIFYLIVFNLVALIGFSALYLFNIGNFQIFVVSIIVYFVSGVNLCLSLLAWRKIH